MHIMAGVSDALFRLEMGADAVQSWACEHRGQ